MRDRGFQLQKVFCLPLLLSCVYSHSWAAVAKADSVVVQQNGNTVAFETGADYNAYLNWESVTTGQWSGWGSLGTAGGGFTTPPAAIVQQSGNTVVFEVGADHNVYFNWESAATEQWSGWGDLGSAGGGFTAAPSVIVQQSGNTVVFEAGGDHNVYFNWESVTTGQWSGWGSLGSAGDGFTTPPAAIVQQNANTVVFAVGADQNVYFNWESVTTGQWSGWESLGSAGGGFTATPAAIVQQNGNTLVFEVGADDNVYLNWQSSTTEEWSGWEGLGSAGGGFTATPAAIVQQNGNTVITEVGVDQNIYLNWQSSTSEAWSGWGGLGSAGGGFLAGGSGTPDPQPAPYPDDLSSPSHPTGSCNITGNWTDSVSGASWSITQNSSNISGSLNLSAGGCGNVTWVVVGQASGNAATLTASNPNPSVDACGAPAASTVTASVAFGSCMSGAVNETANIPGYTNSFGQTYSPQTHTGSGNWTLASQQLTFNLSSPSQIPIPSATNNAQMIPLSTSDTGLQIQTTSSLGSYPFSVNYSAPLEGNTNSSCAASLSIPDGTGTGSAASTISASPSDCSGIFGVYGNVGGTTTQNAIDIVVPPDILIRELWGEANRQAATGDQVSELAVGNAIRQRFKDGVYFSHFQNYQDMNVGPYNQGFDGLNRCAPGCLNAVQHATETLNAAYIFGGVSMAATDVADSKCFVSPTPDDWKLISAALQGQTTLFPGPLQVKPTCWDPTHRQLVYKSSIGSNAGYNTPVPAFIFEQWRDPSWPAVIQIQ